MLSYLCLVLSCLVLLLLSRLDSWSLVFGLWSLVFGLWFLVFGLWSLVFGLNVGLGVGFGVGFGLVLSSLGSSLLHHSIFRYHANVHFGSAYKV